MDQTITAAKELMSGEQGQKVQSFMEQQLGSGEKGDKGTTASEGTFGTGQNDDTTAEGGYGVNSRGDSFSKGNQSGIGGNSSGQFGNDQDVSQYQGVSQDNDAQSGQGLGKSAEGEIQY